MPTIWEELPQKRINRAVHLYLIANKLTLSRASNILPVKAVLKTLRNGGCLI